MAAPVTATPSTSNTQDRPPPDINKLPNNKYGKLARYGHQLSTRTFAYIGPDVMNKKMRYAGNNLACTSCHQQDSSKPFAMPWVGVTAAFPQYRGRQNTVSSMEERINGCMERSMNGKPLPWDSREMKAFVTYIQFLSQSRPAQAPQEASTSSNIQAPGRRANQNAGEAIYKARCMVCHGKNGAGKRASVKRDVKGYLYPPVWGPDSFNTGSGMNRLLTAMRYLKPDTPIMGATHKDVVLSDIEAYDVAGYLVSMPRPVKANLEQDFPERWNKPVDAAYPPYVDGMSADQHKYGPFQPLADKFREAAVKRARGQGAAPATDLRAE
jgi:thiosulfate dehydrogenase